jgi:hypothetical protein
MHNSAFIARLEALEMFNGKGGPKYCAFITQQESETFCARIIDCLAHAPQDEMRANRSPQSSSIF